MSWHSRMQYCDSLPAKVIELALSWAVIMQRRDSDEATTAKKQRVVWSVEMHQQFVAAVNQLGIDSQLLQPRSFISAMMCYAYGGQEVS